MKFYANREAIPFSARQIGSIERASPGKPGSPPDAPLNRHPPLIELGTLEVVPLCEDGRILPRGRQGVDEGGFLFGGELRESPGNSRRHHDLRAP